MNIDCGYRNLWDKLLSFISYSTQFNNLFNIYFFILNDVMYLILISLSMNVVLLFY